ncbi:Cof-type HAD-IIB family hydrolase [Vallicoccus soli]|uniref:HAD family phosphatase n=1 Tax=Vallicoccus soli TaxID=2339232 RepID=A0A3A3ZHR5_9ACTN|nr:Cof-type HAD-IIB family hydrolase [Vallicoccus soli]RJK94900.1 HAD family phosphatase [Vallicoccus soli]
MSARPALVASDLDGTLVRTDGTISDRTVAALRAVEDAGSTVVFVTGRPTRWMGEVAAATGHTGLAICSNGAVVWDLHRERVVETFELSVEVGADLVERLRRALPGIAFGAEAVGGFRHERAYALRYAAPGVTTVDRLELDEPLVKLLVRAEEGDVDELLAAAREVVGDLAEVVHSSTSGEALLEVSASGVSKATTLARMCEERGVDASEVVAFGDMPNDLPMLAWAGTAYAMGNAHPDVLAAADRTTLTNDEDGVAVVLERLFA